MKRRLIARSIGLVFIAYIFIFTISMSIAFADKVTLIGGTTVPGLIVDEYVDRIVISTYEGEKTFKRSEISSIEYDEVVSRLLNLADEARGSKRYKEAAYYYQRALGVDPGSVAAKDGMRLIIREQLLAGTERSREELALMEALEGGANWSGLPRSAVSQRNNVRDLLGIELAIEKDTPVAYVKSVVPGSVAAENGVRENDRIVSVWGKNLHYLSYEQILQELAGPEYSVVKCGIEREVTVDARQARAMVIDLDKDGYFIRDVSDLDAGTAKFVSFGDRLLAVNSVSTRYMPPGELNKMLKDKKEKAALLLKRYIYMTRERR